MSARFSHQFVICYSIESDDRDGEDITPEQHRDAIIARVHQAMRDDEMLEAVGPPADTLDRVEDNAL